MKIKITKPSILPAKLRIYL